MGEFLLELFSEEIPARMQKRAAEDLNKLIMEGLNNNALTFNRSFSQVTPHRLCVVVEGLITKQPNMRDERRGPKVDASDVAVEGFLKSVGLTRNDLEERETSKGTFLFAIINNTGQETKDILPKIIDSAIRAMPWPKSMRWGCNSFRWVRPLHHILAIFDGKKISGHFDLGNETIEYTNMTKGHRFLAPQSFEVASFLDYEQKLKESYVLIDREQRKSIITEQATTLTTAAGSQLQSDPSLLEEVCGLVEWPNSLIGNIQDEFMTLPAEALVCAMRSHQKYFAVTDHLGSLAPSFITVSNMPPNDKRDQTIIMGNEKVLSARLSDAKFFWDQDRKVTLESRVPALSNITFYEKLGSLGEKMLRVEQLALYLSDFIPNADTKFVQRAAKLAKADLTTAMVAEFPELQGIMGGYYAMEDGEDAEISLAIKEHYRPQGPSDSSPTSATGITVSLADKLDTLVGFFAINEKPTGSKDPFALRRYALGVTRLIIENSLKLPLGNVISMALSLYPKFENDNGLIGFITERLKVYLRSEGTRNDRVLAVFSNNSEDDLNRLKNRMKALDIFLSTHDGINLLTAYRRAANIVAIESKKDGTTFDVTPDKKLFQIEEEKHLSDALDNTTSSLTNFLKDEEFDKAMNALAALRAPVDKYFEHVTVNDSDLKLRENRLRSLKLIVETMDKVADFSLIENS